jgi:hypothetical protein
MNCGCVPSLQFRKALQFNRLLRHSSGKMYLLVSKSGYSQRIRAREIAAMRKKAARVGLTLVESQV